MKIIGMKKVVRSSKDGTQTKYSLSLTLTNPYPASVGIGYEAYTYVLYGNTEAYQTALGFNLDDDVLPIVSPDGFVRSFVLVNPAPSSSK